MLRSRFSSASMESRSRSAPVTVTGRPSESADAEELDFVVVSRPPPQDKASRILGIQHRASMEPIPASSRTSLVSTRSARPAPPAAPLNPTSPLTSLYVVGGLPKSPHTWTLAEEHPGLSHSDSAVNRFWRPEVLGSTVSPGAGGGIKKKRRGKEEISKGAGALSKAEVTKMLSKALKLSFTREVEVIASTLQPPSTIHTFQFTLPKTTPLAPTPSGDFLRASVLSASDNRSSAAPSYTYDDPFPRPSTTYLGPSSLLGHNSQNTSNRTQPDPSSSNTVTYHGVCLTVWSHADAERSTAIRRTLEAGRSRKESAQSAVASRLKTLRADVTGDSSDPSHIARRRARRGTRGPWTDVDTDAETDAGGASESEYEAASTVGHGPGESTLFLPGDTVFWLPYALTLVSRHPVFDLMRDYLTLSWARFSKDVQSHTLQISKILAHPAPRPGDLIKLDASPQSEGGDSSLEVIARFPGGLDFGKGLVDINFTMWPLFKSLNLNNILTICEIALAPTGRVIFFSRHPAMLGIAVATTKYLVELRGWSGIALPAVHSRDAKIYVEDPGPWIMGLATEARYSVRPAPEVCVVDLDINYLSCPSPPPGAVSVKQQREKYLQKLLAAFESHYHPDHSIPSEFKEAFPAGRFRPVCKIQAKRGASSAAVAEQIQPPEWWNGTRIIQAFDAVLQAKAKKPSFLKRLSSFGSLQRPVELTPAERLITLSLRKRATAFVDARDDLETKIGRLSRRLNFLMTESDLWRDKFVTFESYAEKLSAEATQLRTKINKEQRETKRLSGLVTLTAADKHRLQTQLKETESAHSEAMAELERMRLTMEKMEQERAEMVAEVEAQIERALASMAVDIESDYASSRPSSRASSLPGSRTASRSRRGSEAKRPLRSFGTESTLAEEYAAMAVTSKPLERETETIPEAEEETPAAPRKKRFSVTEADIQQDGMNAVDESISIKSDRIAQKVLEIQQKLENALANERRTHRKRPSTGRESEGDTSETASTRARPTRPARSAHRPTTATGRTRSSTASSTKTSATVVRGDEESQQYPRTVLIKAAESDAAPRPSSHVQDEQSQPEPIVAATSAPEPLPSLSPVPEMRPKSRARSSSRATSQLGTTDDDSDFQSAYSQESSPEDDEEVRSPLPSEEFGVLPKTMLRDRVISTATVIVAGEDTTPTSPRFSHDTIVVDK